LNVKFDYYSIPKESGSILLQLTIVDAEVNGVHEVILEFELPLQSNVGVDVCDLRSHPITSSMSTCPSLGDVVESSMFVGKYPCYTKIIQ